MKYPHFLMKKGTIGFVAPSFGLADDFRRAGFAHAQERFLQDGYQVKLGPNCYEEKGIGISNTPEKCGQELTEFYCDPECDVLISCAGGELMCETISCLDLERIGKAEPKWFMGYSDNTNFSFLLTTLFDTAAIYGPNARSFGMEPRHQAIQDALELLTGRQRGVSGYDKWQLERNPEEEVNPLAGYLLTEEKVLKLWLPGGESTGKGDTGKVGSGKDGIGEGGSSAGVEMYGAGSGRNDSIAIESVLAGKEVCTGNRGGLTHGDKPTEVDDYEADCAADGQSGWIADCRKWSGSMEMSGRLIGGCMDCLVNLLGTRFDGVNAFLEKYKEDGFIWFLESCDLSVLSIRRAMWQMEEAGWFRYVKGFLIGRPLCFGQEMMGLDAYEAVLGIARKHRVPVVMDVDLGHLPPAMPIVSGSIGKVSMLGNRIRIEYEYR